MLPSLEGRYTPEPNSGCWLWTGAMSGSGYGAISIGPRKAQKTYQAHRGLMSVTREKSLRVYSFAIGATTRPA